MRMSRAEQLARHNHFLDQGFGLAGKASAPAPDVKSELDQPWQSDLLEQFLVGQLRVAPLLPLLTVAIALTALIWVPVSIVAPWMVVTLASHFFQFYLSKIFLSTAKSRYHLRDWIGIFSTSELAQACCWSSILFLFWPEAALPAQIFLVAALLILSVMRFLLVSNYMPVLIAGTGTITAAIALRCQFEAAPTYLAIAALVLALEGFFLFIARNLHETAKQAVVLRLEKDALIEELKVKTKQADEDRTAALQANRAKSVFLANMSHELRTPLNAILGFSEVLNLEMFGPIQNNNYKSYAGDIHNSGQHLLSLINDILDLSRIEAGRRDLNEEPVSVRDPSDEALRLLAMRARAKDITIKIKMDPTLPKLLMDRRAADQIIINLVNNAVKFTQKGGEIEISAMQVSDGGFEWCVKDNGPGIPENEITQALTAFTRGTFATKRDIDGAGLGLPIVSALMEVHGGRLDIKSEMRVGTRVICYFPQQRVLSGPRAEIISGPTVSSESQRLLIKYTG